MFDRAPQSNELRRVMDACLPGLENRPDFDRDVLRQARGEIKVKRKLSVGLALAIVFMLLVAGAVAAVILSMRQIVEEEAIPMANEYAGEAYTAEDTNALVMLAEENGIALSAQTKAQIQQALDQGEGYFKEELLMALAKADFGENPATWTLEQQKWFDDVCVAIGFISEPEKAMPDDGESAKNPIVQAAAAYIHKTYEPDAPLDDLSKYTIGVQYINGGEDDEYQGLYWSIDYSPLYLEGAKYWVYLRDDGTVLGDSMTPGMQEGSTIDVIKYRYIDVFGWDFSTWTQETLQSFRNALKHSSSTNDKAVLCILKATYPFIDDQAISKEMAISIAASTIGAASYTDANCVYIGDDPNPIWKVRIQIQTEIVADDPLSGFAVYYVEIDSITSDVKTVYQRNNRYDYWYREIVLDKVIEKIDESWIDDTPSVG